MPGRIGFYPDFYNYHDTVTQEIQLSIDSLDGVL